jgi:hypothetical protein
MTFRLSLADTREGEHKAFHSKSEMWWLVRTHYKKGAPLEYVLSALLKLLQKGAPFYDQR